MLCRYKRNPMNLLKSLTYYEVWHCKIIWVEIRTLMEMHMPKIMGGIQYSHTRIVYWHDTSCYLFSGLQ